MSFQVPESNLGKFLVIGSTATFSFVLGKFVQGGFSPLTVVISASLCAYQWREYSYRGTAHEANKLRDLALLASVAFFFTFIRSLQGQISLEKTIVAGGVTTYLWRKWAQQQPAPGPNPHHVTRLQK